MSALREAVAAVEAARAYMQANLPPNLDGNYTEWRNNRNAVIGEAGKRLKAAGATMREDFKGGRFALAGITATSTSGWTGAMGNWLTRARAALDEQGDQS